MNTYYGSVVSAHIPPINGGQTDIYFGNEGKLLENNFHSNPQNMCYENDNHNSYGMNSYHGFQQNFDRHENTGHNRLVNLPNKQTSNPYCNNMNGYVYQNPNTFMNSCNGNVNVNTNTCSPPGLGAPFHEDRFATDRLGNVKSEENCIPTPPPNNFSPHEHTYNHINNNLHHGISPTDISSHNTMTGSPPLPQHCNGMMNNPYPWMRQLPGMFKLNLSLYLICQF